MTEMSLGDTIDGNKGRIDGSWCHPSVWTVHNIVCEQIQVK